MSTNKTANLNLHAWEPTDAFMHTEVNENFAALDENAGLTWERLEALGAADAALRSSLGAVDAKVPKIAYGTYTGTASGSAYASQTISLGFQPKAVLIAAYGAGFSGNNAALLIRGETLSRTSDGKSYLLGQIAASGFTVGAYYDNEVVAWFQPVVNANGSRYFYLAIG